MDVSLEIKVKAVAMFVPEEVCADALKPRTPPSTREVLPPGVRLTRPGKIGGPGLVPPPQPLKLHRERMATNNRKAFERNLPMHPSLCLVAAVRGEITQGEPSNELENL
jgi:hypothetical protein